MVSQNETRQYYFDRPNKYFKLNLLTPSKAVLKAHTRMWPESERQVLLVETGFIKDNKEKIKEIIINQPLEWSPVK